MLLEAQTLDFMDVFMVVDFLISPLCVFLCDRYLLRDVNIYVASFYLIHFLLSLSAALFIPLYLMILCICDYISF